MKQEQIKNILAAGCLGDAFGYRVEFDDWGRIKHYFGPQGVQQLENNPDIPVATDDTQMTLFAVEGILSACNLPSPPVKDDFVQHAKWAFLRWYETQSFTSNLDLPYSIFSGNSKMFVRRAPGNTCLSALSDRYAGTGTIEAPTNDSKGCGVVMRSAPYAFLIDSFSDDEIWEITARCGAITHGHVDGWASGAALAYLLAQALRGTNLLIAIENAAVKAESVGAESTAKLMRSAVKVSHAKLDPEALCDLLGEGWTGDEALAISIYSALHAKSVTEAIIIGTNHRGDSDSTASIAGQIAALRFGMTDDEMKEFGRVDLASTVLLTAELLAAELQY